MFFLLVSLVCARQKTDDDASVKAGIEKLHKKTEFATFYDLFDITGNANAKQIQKIYKKNLKEKKTLPGFNFDESEKFFTEAYNILSKNRYTYDYLLKYQCFPSEAYNWHYWIIVFVIGLLMCDFLGLFYRYKKLQGMDKKARKKIEKKGKAVRGIMFSELFCVKVMIWLKRKTIG